MKLIGLTGGIGSGKSTIARMFEELGVPVYYADIEAKKLMHSSIIKNKLISLFGKKSYKNSGLNTVYIANIVFKDKDKLNALNKIVHPEVNKHFKNWIKNQNATYVIQENAIIFESKNQNDFDFIITVTAPEELKIERVISRDHISKESVLARMENQLDDAYKINNSNYVIHNTDLKQSKDQVFKLHNVLSKNLSKICIFLK